MTRRVSLLEEKTQKSDYQLPPGQLWWMLRYCDEDRVSECLFTYEGERMQTWFYANKWAQVFLRELGLGDTLHYSVSIYAKHH